MTDPSGLAQVRRPLSRSRPRAPRTQHADPRRGCRPDIKITPIVDGVLIPMAMQFAPDGRMFFNEVSKGTVRILNADLAAGGAVRPARVARRKEMGAIGLALHPDFAQNHWVYVFYSERRTTSATRTTTGSSASPSATAKPPSAPGSSATFRPHSLPQRRRIGFGHDGKLYVLAGDVNDDGRVQNMNRLHGKILASTTTAASPPTTRIEFPIFAIGFEPVRPRLSPDDRRPLHH